MIADANKELPTERSDRAVMRDVVGYKGFGPNRGKFIDADVALEYVLAQCGLSVVDSDAPDAEEAMEALEEWFFSDNWSPVYEDEEDEEDDGEGEF